MIKNWIDFKLLYESDFIKEGKIFSFSVSQPQILLALPITFLAACWLSASKYCPEWSYMPPLYPEIWSCLRWTLHGDDDPRNQGKHRWPLSLNHLPAKAQHLSAEELWRRYESNCNFIVKLVDGYKKQPVHVHWINKVNYIRYIKYKAVTISYVNKLMAIYLKIF